MIVLGLTNQSGNWLRSEGWSGCGYHRILNPLGSMKGIQGLVADEIGEDTEIDILIYNRVSQYDENWDAIKEKYHCKIILDLDDYWRNIPLIIRHDESDIMADRIENNIKKADLVIVTNSFLAEKALQFNPNVCIIENGLPYGETQYTSDKIYSDKVRIFWAGSYSHVTDMSLLKNPMNKLLCHKDKIEVVIGGYDERSKNVWDIIVSNLTVGKKLPYRTLSTKNIFSYMDLYKEADIMVIPLEDTVFNHGKSNLKLLEAASKKLPVIISNQYPYSVDKDAPVLWVNSQKDWFTHLNYLILNPSVRKEMGEKLYNWACIKYNLDLQNKKRYLAFKYVLN